MNDESVTSYDPLTQYVSTAQAALDRLRVDYDIQLLHGRKASADLEQRCNRCGYWIQIGQPIDLIEKADRSRKDWVHHTCPGSEAA
jgi:hypothetical protein